jgi:hypothetical protein
MIRLKEGVNLDGVHPMIFYAIFKAGQIWERHREDLVLTSVNDGVHPGGVRPSFHPRGLAFDGRTHNLEAPMIACEELAAALGPDFDVLLESQGTGNEHVHCQYDVPDMPGRIVRGP